MLTSPLEQEAAALLGCQTQRCKVLLVDGASQTGKSSLLNIIVAQLQPRCVINVSPNTITRDSCNGSAADALIAALASAAGSAVDECSGAQPAAVVVDNIDVLLPVDDSINAGRAPNAAVQGEAAELRHAVRAWLRGTDMLLRPPTATDGLDGQTSIAVQAAAATDNATTGGQGDPPTSVGTDDAPKPPGIVYILATCTRMSSVHPAVLSTFRGAVLHMNDSVALGLKYRSQADGSKNDDARLQFVDPRLQWLCCALEAAGLPVVPEGQRSGIDSLRHDGAPAVVTATGTPTSRLVHLCPGLTVELLDMESARQLLDTHGHGFGPADCTSVARAAAATIAVLVQRAQAVATADVVGAAAPSTIYLSRLLSSLMLGHTPLGALSSSSSTAASTTATGSMAHGVSGGAQGSARHGQPLSTHLQRAVHLLPGLVKLEDHRPDWLRPATAADRSEEARAAVHAMTRGAMAFAGGSRDDLIDALGADGDGGADGHKDDDDDAELDTAPSGASLARLGAEGLGSGSDLGQGIPWDSVAGQDEAKAALARVLSTLLPRQHLHGVSPSSDGDGQRGPASAGRTAAATATREALRSMLGLPRPCGALLYGPPGTGKTLLARAVAGSCAARFLPLSIPSILKAGVGDSERALSRAFALACAAAPCVIFLDEVQALFPSTSNSKSGEDDEERRMTAMLTAALLACLDDVAARPPSVPPVVVLAATNVPWALDPSLLTPSRLGSIVYVGLPIEKDRSTLLEARLARMPIRFEATDPAHASMTGSTPLAAETWLSDVRALAGQLAQRTTSYSSADLANLCRLAAAEAVAMATRGTTGRAGTSAASASITPILTPVCFWTALSRMRPSVDAEQEAAVRSFSLAKHLQGH